MEDIQHDGMVATVVVDRYRGNIGLGRNREYLRGAAATFVEQAKRLGFGAQPIGVASNTDDEGPVTAGREQIRGLVTKLRNQQASRKILYWTGHGHQHGDVFYLACEDSYVDGHLDPSRAVSARELAAWMGNDFTDTWLVLDACFSGQALEAVEAQVKAARKKEVGDDPAGGLVVVATAGADERATETRWVDCLEQVLDTPELEENQHRLFAREQPDVPLDYLHRAVAARMRGQAPKIEVVRPLRPLFLVNPYCSDRVRPATRHEDDESWIGEELRSELIPLFSGAGETWRLRDFSSRNGALGSLVTWMNIRSTGMFVVTGASGSGKSTLLNYVAHLTTKKFAASLPADRLPQIQPELHSVHAAVHCRGRTLTSLCEELAARLERLGLDRATVVPGEAATYVKEISGLAARKGTLTLMFDGLDEAAVGHSFRMARELLNRLAALPRVKVVVATRTNARRVLPGDMPEETLVDVLKGDRRMELDRLIETEQDLARHVENLLGQLPSSPRTPEGYETRAAAARRVAAHSNGLFLVATLWARRLARLDVLPDADRLDAELRQESAVLDALLDEELQHLDPEKPTRIRDLMRPLALAQGIGLPPSAIWLAMANATRDAKEEYTEEDLRRFTRQAAGVVVTADEEFGEPVYRLHHPSFGGHLLAGRDERHLHALAYRALRPPSGNGWADVAPYVSQYLAAHAALAGDEVLEELVADHHFLVHSSPEVLEPLVAARASDNPHAALYLRVADQFRTRAEVSREVLITRRWAVLRATALVMFPAKEFKRVPRVREVFWDDLWSSADRLPLQRIWPAPAGGAMAVHWERDGDGLIHAAGEGEIKSWTWSGREVRGREATARGVSPRQGGVAAAGAGDRRVVASHDNLAVRVWRGDERHPSEELFWGGTVKSVEVAQWEGRACLAAVEGEQMWLWDWDSGAPYAREKVRLRRIGGVRRAALLPLEDDLLAVTGGPGGLTLWKLTGKEPQPTVLMRLWEGAQWIEAVGALASHEGRGAVIAALDGQMVRVWTMDDVHEDRCDLLFSRKSAARSLALGRRPSGLVVAVQEDRQIRIWSGDGVEQVPLPCDHEHGSLAFDPSGSGRLAVADDTRVRVWNPHAPDDAGSGRGLVDRSLTADGNPLVHAVPSRDGTFLVVRSQGRAVLVSRHTSSGRVVDGPVLEHQYPVKALSAVWTEQGWLVVAVGRRQAMAWTLGTDLRERYRDRLTLEGAGDDAVLSVALRAGSDGRISLYWPQRQAVRCWERPAGAHAEWQNDGRAVRYLQGAAAVQRVAVVDGPGDAVRLAAWGGSAIRVWDLTDPGARPYGGDDDVIRAAVTGLVRRGTVQVPLAAYAGRRWVHVVEWLNGRPLHKRIRPPGGVEVQGLALAGPPERLVLVSWGRNSGRLMLRDLVGRRDLPPLESRGYPVADVASVHDDRGTTLLIQGTEDAGMRCDQVLLRTKDIERWWRPEGFPQQRIASPEGSEGDTP